MNSKIESLKQPEMEGVALRDQVRDRISYVENHGLTPGKPKHFVANTILNNFDELDPVLWSKPRSKAEINSITAGSYVAFQRAYFSRNFKHLYDADSDLKNAEDYDRAWKDVFKYDHPQRMFTKYFWDQPISYAPSRVPVFYHIIRDFYEKPENHRPLALVDLGAGPAHTIPLLNSSRVLAGDIEGKDIVSERFENAGDLPIACGISIDKYASEYAAHRADDNMEDPLLASQLRNLYKLRNKWEFLSFAYDVNAYADDCHAAIVKWTNNLTGRSSADIVISSFLAYQLGADIDTQSRYRKFQTRLLRKGGYLIEVGDELLTSNPDLRYKVHVYKKVDKDGEEILEEIGVPFVIDDGGKVLEINYNYFQ